jgi:hypothetical protein
MYNTIFIELELMEHIMKDGNYYLVNGFCERNKKKNNSSIKINKSGDVWLPMNIFQGTLMHELGHAFGMDHTDHIPFKSVLKSTAQFYGRTMHVECLDAKDKTVSVACSAGNDTGKCGYADHKSYQISTFDNNKATKDFLCYGALSATGLGNPSKSLPSEWNWICGEEKCSATVLECGQGNLGYYTERDFYANRYNYPAFMCSNGNVAVREWRAECRR